MSVEEGAGSGTQSLRSSLESETPTVRSAKSTNSVSFPVPMTGGGGTCSPRKLTINLITGALGSGILSLPWSTAGATLIPALVIIALVLFVNAWTIRILVEAAEKYQTFDLGGLLGRLPGALGVGARSICNIVVWVSMFLCLVGYFVIIADSASRAGVGMIGRPLIIVIASVMVLPLCFLDQSRLSFTSTITVSVNFYIIVLLVALLIGELASGSLEPPCIVSFGAGSVAMVTAMMQSVIIQMCVLPMYEELQDRTPEKFHKIVVRAFVAIFVLFALFSVAGQMVYGLTVESNVLKNFPKDVWGTTAQAGTVVAITGVYPIMIVPMVAPVRNSAWKTLEYPITALIELASAAVAVFVSDLGFLNVINGALQVGVFVGVVPGIVGIVLLQRGRILLSSSAFVCLCVSILGFIYTDNYAGSVGEKCLLPR